MPRGLFDFDWLVVGSGFGGSVAALRLTQRGDRVGVLEAGRRFGPDDFPSTTWDVRRWSDGSAVPANVGVHPARTITALAERAMTFVPAAQPAAAAVATTEAT